MHEEQQEVLVLAQKKAIGLRVFNVVRVQGNLCTAVAFDDLSWMKNQVFVGPGFAAHGANYNEIRRFVSGANVFEGGIGFKTAKATGERGGSIAHGTEP
jgi:hypothetical protein